MSTTNLENKRIDKYLTNFAVKYKEGMWAADFIAPPFSVVNPSDKYLLYTKADFRIYDNKISGREKAKEIDLKANDSSYSCEEYSLGTFIGDRAIRNTQDTGIIRLQENKVANLKRAQRLAREKRIWAIAGSTSVVTNYVDKNAAWATPSTAAPVSDILTGMGTVETNSGCKPNAIIMGYDVALKMIACTEWKEYFRYTSNGFGQGLFDAIAGLRNFGLEPMITNVRGVSTYEGAASDPTWETMISDSVLIFYREATPTVESMSFMYSPFTVYDQIESYRVNGERGTRYEIYEEIDELLVNAECAYLITDTI